MICVSVKKNLLLDVDGVIRDIVATILDIYNTQYDPGAGIIEKDIYDFDMSKVLLKTPDIVGTFFRKHAEEVFTYSKPHEQDFAETISRIKENYNVHLLTAQFPGNEKYTLQWIEQNKVPYDSIIFAKEKNIIKGDFLLDDAIHNLESVAGNGTRVVCMNRPWNQAWRGERVYSLKEFEQLILPKKH